MNHINLFDSLFGISLVFAIFLGMLRGNGRETLHTFLFGLAMLAGWLFLRSGDLPSTQEDLARLVVSIGFYAMAMYIFCWALMGVLAPFMLDSGVTAGIRSRFWAGAQALVKLALVVLGVNLWYAAYSVLPVWERLQPLPPLLRDSTFIAVSDKVTDDTHRWLASQRFMGYQYDSNTIPAPTNLTPLEPMVEAAPAPTEAPMPTEAMASDPDADLPPLNP
jgi:hypothetical protein